MLGSGEQMRGTYYPLRLNLKKGSLWMQDGRAIHRGTPNRSDRPRDELCMAFSAPWVFSRHLHDNTAPHLPRDLWESLSDRARHALRLQRVLGRARSCLPAGE